MGSRTIFARLKEVIDLSLYMIPLSYPVSVDLIRDFVTRKNDFGSCKSMLLQSSEENQKRL